MSFLDKLILQEVAALILTLFGRDLLNMYMCYKNRMQTNDIANLPIRRSEIMSFVKWANSTRSLFSMFA